MRLKRTNIPETLHFPPAQYAHFPLEKLTPQEIDQMLANGYFRNGPNAFAGLGRYIDGEWFPNLMLRIPLTHFQWKKRSRKLLRRNARHFEVRIGPLELRQEMEDLWHLFKAAVHGWERVAKLSDYLFSGLPPANFQTHEVAVYFQNRLVAFSIFDRGESSLAALEAAYHPDFQQFSLGYYTMLLEMEYGMGEALAMYYPGFFPKNHSMFGYKLRPGGIEFFHFSKNRWLPWEQRTKQDWLAEKVEDRLAEVRDIYRAHGIHVEMMRTFHTNMPGQVRKLGDHQVFLEIIQLWGDKKCQRIRVGFDVFSKKYEVFGQDMVLKKPDNPLLYAQKKYVPIGGYSLFGTATEAEKVVDICMVNGWGGGRNK